MNKSSFLAPAALLAIFGLSACEKEDMSKVFDANFYATHNGAPLILYVDDVRQGTLSYLAAPPVCGQSYSDGTRPVSMQLPSGDYRISGRDATGQEVVSTLLHISGNVLSVKGGIGGTQVENHGTCLSVGLWE